MINLDNILKWYSGKPLTVIRDYVIPTLAQAAQDGFWPKGASRKVHAALNKQTVAKKFYRCHRDCIDNISTGNYQYDGDRAWGIGHAFLFGQYSRANYVKGLVDKLLPALAEGRVKLWIPAPGSPHPTIPTVAAKGAVEKVLDTAEQWAADFAPVAALVAQLDIARPKPNYVMGTISPTVLANLGGILGFQFDSIALPQVKWEWVEREVNGKKYRICVGDIVWPEGTRHGASKFSISSSGNHQCEACGHAIRNPWNWVPLVAKTADGPVSLWVGRDCAQNLFGCVLSGEGEYSDKITVPASGSSIQAKEV